jgi:predicted transcriptional regulator
LKKNGARTEEIIKGTKLHPSTVRETLSKMHDQKQIYRKKIKNENIGKNPYLYYPIPPIKLLKKYKKEFEERLNKIANLDFNGDKNSKNSFKIKIIEKAADKI